MKEFNAALSEWKTKHEQVREAQGDVVDKDGNVNYGRLAAYAAAHGNTALMAALQTDPNQAAEMYMKYEKNAAELDKIHAETSADIARSDWYKNKVGGNGGNGLVVGGVEKQVFDRWYSDQLSQGLTPTPEQMEDKLADIKSINAERTSEARSVGSREGSIKVASEAVAGAVNLAVAASNSVDRTKYPTLNAAIEATEKGTGDQNVVDFIVKNNTLINEYAAAQNPRGQPRIGDKEHAREMLDLAYSKGQYQTAANAILSEIKNIKQATSDVDSEYNGGKKSPVNSIPPDAISALKAGHGTKEQFDEVFGAGAADRALNGR
jgi:hypothetical protein